MLELIEGRETRSDRARPAAKVRIGVAAERERETIFRLRHDIYARELGQHDENPAGELRDALDDFNTYLTASLDGEILGFISITPPGRQCYSIDKYFSRDALPFRVDDELYEVRTLSVVKKLRSSRTAILLMYAAFRWIEARGGKRIVAIGRREVLSLYLKVGFQPLNRPIRSGAVTFELMSVSLDALRERIGQNDGTLHKLAGSVAWDLEIPFYSPEEEQSRPAPCYHGGAFFDAIGPEFDSLDKRRDVINADVLDAWFPPSPKVLEALREHLPWLLRTSPPTNCEGMARAIARARGVEPENILPGAGSSDLIYLALRHWLTPASRVLILDPMYGEYAHVLERVIGCQTDRLTLSRDDGYAVNLDRLKLYSRRHYDLIVLVNPNSPTGRHVAREELEKALRGAPAGTRVWLDETYVEYAGPEQSLERFAAESGNVVVCKSMSKVYALSGARAAYLCAGPRQIDELRAISPPWSVGLPGQVAAVKALQDAEYYEGRYRETHALRAELVDALQSFCAMEIVPSTANFILCHLPPNGPDAATVVRRCRARGLFLRDVSTMGTLLGSHAIRLAVKDRETNRRMLEILRDVLP